jgi:hypothetical protein
LTQSPVLQLTAPVHRGGGAATVSLSRVAEVVVFHHPVAFLLG